MSSTSNSSASPMGASFSTQPSASSGATAAPMSPISGQVQLAMAKPKPLAHHHPHQQALGTTRQRGEVLDETLLVSAEHIGITLRQPSEHLLEVVQVVKRIVEGTDCHGKNAKDIGYWLCIQITAVNQPGNSKR